MTFSPPSGAPAVLVSAAVIGSVLRPKAAGPAGVVGVGATSQRMSVRINGVVGGSLHKYIAALAGSIHKLL